MRRAIAGLLNGSVELLGFIVGAILRRGLETGLIYFPFVSEGLSRFTFAFGWKLRRAVYARILPKVGQGVVLHSGVVLEDARSCFGDDVWVSTGCYLDYVHISDHVLVGPHAVLLSGGRHHRFDRLDVPIKLQGNHPKEPLTIGRGAWIGANATVMADVGRDAVVGAGAVVTKPVPDYAIVGGNPAQIIRMRIEGAAEI